MTASTITQAASAAATPRFAGLGALVRKERMEWFRGRRAWVVLAVTTVFMTLTAANAWITTSLRNSFPPDEAIDFEPMSMAPLDNIAAAVVAQAFILVAIFAVASLMVRERESGTLAWVASKPVSRRSIFAAKWIAASTMLAVVAAVVPLGITTALVVALYGVPEAGPVVALGIGMIAEVVFYAVVGITFGTFLPGAAAVAGVGFAVFALPLLVGLIPLGLTQFLPHEILGWIVGVATGQDVGFATPVAYAVVTGGVAWYGMRRLDRLEL